MTSRGLKFRCQLTTPRRTAPLHVVAGVFLVTPAARLVVRRTAVALKKWKLTRDSP